MVRDEGQKKIGPHSISRSMVFEPFENAAGQQPSVKVATGLTENSID